VKITPLSTARARVRLATSDGEPTATVSASEAAVQAVETTDTELIRALRSGDARAATAFFDRHAPRVERLLARILGPSSDLADALNETFRRAFDRLDRVDRPEGVGAWLCQIGVMVAREELRTRRRRGWLELFAPEALPEPAARRDEDDKEALARVFDLLDELPDDDRVMFVLRHLESFELTEIASTTNVSLASVKRHLARAEKRFFARCSRDPVLSAFMDDLAPQEEP